MAEVLKMAICYFAYPTPEMGATVSSAGGFPPGRLWSLWDMLEHNAEAFCRFSSMLGQMLVVLDMPTSPDWSVIVSTLAQLQREADRMRMTGVNKVLDRIKEHVTGGPGASAATVRPMIVELYNRLRDDLEVMLFLHVEPDRTKFYKQETPLFGSHVSSTFPSVIDEVVEAGKCYALDRPTASAFHSIRCLEAGIRAISRSLGIPDPTRGADRTWGNLLRAVKSEIDRRWPANTGRMSGDAKLFDEAYGALAGMQNPYRNSTMHLDHKYTDDEARHLFELVRGFMVMVANRMDENGQPLA